MDLSMIDLGDAAKIVLAGRLDTTGVNEIELRFTASVVPQARDTLVDLTGVTFVSSMGLRMLIGTARALANKRAKLVLFGAAPMVAESFGHAGLADVVPIADDEAHAVALLRT